VLPYLMSGGTDNKALSKLGIVGYGFAPLQLPAGLRYLTENSARNLFDFPPDMMAVPVEVHRLNNQMLVRYFEEEWAHYVH
jgi:predicted membrane-bound spermidine synthase